MEPDIESPSWMLVTEENTGIFKCKGIGGSLVTSRRTLRQAYTSYQRRQKGPRSRKHHGSSERGVVDTSTEIKGEEDNQ